MNDRIRECFLTAAVGGNVKFYDENLCIKVGKGKNILLIGDSFSAHYYTAIKDQYPEFSISQANASGCRPLLPFEGDKWCTDLMEIVFGKYLTKYQFDTIIISASWKYNELEKLKNTIETINEKVENVIVIGPLVEYTQPLALLLARFQVIGSTEARQISDARILEEKRVINNKMAHIVGKTNALFISVLDKMCKSEQCTTTTAVAPIQFDKGHLTEEGAKFIINGSLKL